MQRHAGPCRCDCSRLGAGDPERPGGRGEAGAAGVLLAGVMFPSRGTGRYPRKHSPSSLEPGGFSGAFGGRARARRRYVQEHTAKYRSLATAGAQGRPIRLPSDVSAEFAHNPPAGENAVQHYQMASVARRSGGQLASGLPSPAAAAVRLRVRPSGFPRPARDSAGTCHPCNPRHTANPWS